MQLAFFITARMGSTRLSRKHMRDLAGQPALRHLIERVKVAAEPEDLIVIATGPQSENFAFEAFACPPKLVVFFGDATHIPRRHLQAAQYFGVSAVVAVDGDDLLISISAMQEVAKHLREGAGLVRSTGLPLGMNAWGYNVSLLSKVLEVDNGCETMDTGWGKIFDCFAATVKEYPVANAQMVRMTLDYPEDLEFFRRIFAECPAGIISSDFDLLKWIVDRDIQNVNQYLNARYWQNFYRS